MAVYTQVSDEELKTFLKDYDIGEFQQKIPIAEGVENTNYRLETDLGNFVLTLFEKRTNEADLPFFMELMAHLASRRVPAPSPVMSNQSGFIGALAERPAVIVEFLPGKPEMTPGPAHCDAIGKTLADLHDAVGDFPMDRANALSVEGWRALADACRARADNCAPGLSQLIDDELGYLEKSWPRSLPKGVVHADLFPDNVLFQNSVVTGVIDFYFSCTDFFAYDIAVCVNAWCFDQQRRLAPKNAQALMSAYFKHRTFTQEEIDAFPTLLRAAALRFLLTRLYDWLHQVDGAIVTVKDPLEYRDILEFHRRLYSPENYGIDE